MTIKTVITLNDYCHINGGASHVAIDEAIGLSREGLRVFFFGANGPVCHELQEAPLEVICLEQPELINFSKNPAVAVQGLWNFKAYDKLTALLKTLDRETTIVHLHGYTKALTTSPVRAAVKQGFKVICTLHDYFTACPNGAFFNYKESKPCPKIGLSLDCISTDCDKRKYGHKLYRVARSEVQKHAGMLPSGITDYINLSNRQVRMLTPYMPENVRFHQLDNIINVPLSPPVNVAANTMITAVGRLDVEKGIQVLLEATRKANLPLLLIGEGPLRKLAETYENCRITGWVTPSQVIEHLNSARCLVLPSLWYEGLPMVVTEAAGRGIPAIVSDISASAERVIDGVHGWHAVAGDVDDLVRCLNLAKNNDAIRATGQASYDNFWNTAPTMENHTRGVLEIYEKITSSRAVA